MHKTILKPLNKNIPKTHQKSTPNLTDFRRQMTPAMSTKLLHKSTWGALWGHMGPKEAQKGGPGTLGTQNGGPGPIRSTICITFGSYFGCFPISFTTSFRLCRTISASISNETIIKKIRQKRKDRRTNEQADK